MAASLSTALSFVCRQLLTTSVHKRCLASVASKKLSEISTKIIANRSEHMKITRSFSLNSTLLKFDYETATRFERVLRLLGKLDYSENKLKHSGVILYTKCTDDINYNEFISFCNLSDTFNSWFLLTELHVWLCMVRLMHEGDEGRIVRNSVVESLWKDAETRVQKLGSIAATKRKKEIADLNEQFLAAIFTYDEGLQGDDKILAGALWRQLLQSECDKSPVLEGMVSYVRQQTLHLESFSRHDVLLEGNISWLPLPDVKQYDRI